MCASLLLTHGCASEEASLDAGETGTEGQQETDGDPEPDTDAETEGSGETESNGETESEADTDTPADCSCFDPWVDAVALDDRCRPADDVVRGCDAEVAPCRAIVLSGGFSESGGEETEFEDAEAVECVVRQLAEGHEVRFTIRSELYNGSVTEEYVPRPEGGYHRYSCGLVDNPPILASVTGIATPNADAVTACVATYDDDADVSALFECMSEQLITNDDAVACE
ncbi:MAG: hypothetical protein ACRBN8_14820 [Nannocystales bacterium]